MKVATGQQMRSAERLLTVLASFSRQSPARTITEISKELDLSAATVRRLVQTLQSHGFVTLDEDRGIYRLGNEVVRLASVALAGSSIVQIASPFLDQLNEDLNEAIQLTIRDGADLIVIDVRQSRHLLQTFHTVGHRYPAYRGSASGQVLLADLGSDALRAVLPAPDHWGAATPNAPKGPDDLAALLAETRDRGYAINNAMTDPNVWAVAAPLRRATGEAIAALNIPAPHARASDPARRDTIVARLLDASHRINDAAVFTT